ncbi:hypothetical protein MNBD_GAMMA18-2413, partial [hydrothermal vent metagenome]
AWTPDDKTEIYIAPRYYREKISNNVLSDFIPGVGELKKKKNEDASRFGTTLGVERTLDNGGRLRGWLLRENWRDVTQQDVITTPEIELQRTAEIDTYRAELQWDQPWGENHIFTSGLLLGREVMDQYQGTGQIRAPEVDGEEKRNIEAYLQDDIFVGEQWEIVPGVRVQDDSNFGFYAAPKINAMYTPDWFADVITNVRMGIGRGYRVPNLKERFFIFDHSQLASDPYMLLGNNALQPESSDSYQLGIEFARPGEFHADITLFHNRIKNLINRRINPDKSTPDLRIFDYQNFARAITQGIETTAKYRFSPSFSVNGGITYLEAEDLKTNKPLTGLPEWLVKLGVDYVYKPWGTSLSLRGIYQSEEWVEDYSDVLVQSPAWTTWDIKFNQPLVEGLTLFAGIDNITNEYRNPNDDNDARPYKPRLLYLGLRIEQ